MELSELLKLCAQQGASDIHLFSGESPVLRIDGRLQRTTLPALTSEMLDSLLLNLMSAEQREQFARDADINFAIQLPGCERFRVNIHRQQGTIAAALRRLPHVIPSLQELGVPTVAEELALKPNGLVLVTGPAGMGKSTTLAAMVDVINRQRESMIVLIEDPVEFHHPNKMSYIKQREVSLDTPTFAMALKNALRQDPDVIVVGEMRDLETIATALTAAETGHLVLTTVHTPDAAQTVQRLIDVFPAHQQAQVRAQLADALQGVISQVLLPKIGGVGRALATEVLINTPAMRNLIRQGLIEQIPSHIQTGARAGMHTMEKSLAQLVEDQVISCETATGRVRDAQDFRCPVWSHRTAGLEALRQ
jgi:twitching motility protein PilT